ncbi:hypothetical protein [Mesorhizobium sp. NPDC059024]|uniref:hypothetical protein n=1 Tax=Mesorhizobium sp. NPDC059024 TaxID=3346707 RepID=UPI00367A0A73
MRKPPFIVEQFSRRRTARRRSFLDLIRQLLQLQQSFPALRVPVLRFRQSDFALLLDKHRSLALRLDLPSPGEGCLVAALRQMKLGGFHDPVGQSGNRGVLFIDGALQMFREHL